MITIVAALAAMSIPSYLSQREKAYRTQAFSDMKNVGLALQTWAIDHDGSCADMDGATQATPELASEGFNASEWVSLLVAADDTSFCILGSNVRLPDKEFVLRSDGGSVEIHLDGSSTC